MDQKWSSLEVGLCKEVLATITQCEFKKMTPVQVYIFKYF